MSYHLDMEKKGKVPNIDMPPLPEETATQEPEVHSEVAKEDVEHASPHEYEAEEAQEQETQELPEQKVVQESQNAKNIRALREKAERTERIERERDELYRKLHEMEAARQKQVQPIVEKEEDSEIQYAPDDLVEAKYLKRYDKKIKELEEKLYNTEHRATLQSVEARLKATYPDIEKVVNADNIEILKATYPELAQSLSSNPDVYSKASATYTMIKKLGIVPEDTYVEDKQRIQKNAVKPRPLASVAPQQGDSPLSKANAFANGLTDELKAQLRREMEEARKNM